MDEHIWTVESRHLTSEGLTVYEACPCGARRIRTQTWAQPAEPAVNLPRPDAATGRGSR